MAFSWTMQWCLQPCGNTIGIVFRAKGLVSDVVENLRRVNLCQGNEVTSEISDNQTTRSVKRTG